MMNSALILLITSSCFAWASAVYASDGGEGTERDDEGGFGRLIVEFKKYEFYDDGVDETSYFSFFTQLRSLFHVLV